MQLQGLGRDDDPAVADRASIRRGHPRPAPGDPVEEALAEAIGHLLQESPRLGLQRLGHAPHVDMRPGLDRDRRSR